MPIFLKKLLILIGWISPPKEDTSALPHEPRAQYIEEAGRWYFKRNILDELDDYFQLLGKLRKVDADTYKMCARLGAVIGSPNMLMLGTAHLSKIDGNIPAFGAVSFPPDASRSEGGDIDGLFPAKFAAFRKYEKPPYGLEPADGDVYGVVWFYISTEKKMRFTWPFSFFVSVASDGSVKLLKQRGVEYQKIPKGGRVPHIGWRHPAAMRESYTEHSGAASRHETIDEFAATVFLLTVQMYRNASADIRVRVEKGRTVAAFSVDMLRTPYFFKDRDITVNQAGSRQKIFHIVRTHKRTLADGQETYVKSHFRGERRFMWNGYSVNITMPGLHHGNLMDFTGGAHDFPIEEPTPRGMVGSSRTARMLDEHVNV